MKVFYTDTFVLPLPEGHTFPMTKYRLLRAKVEASGLLKPGELCEPTAATDEELLRAHDADYLAAMKAGTVADADMRRIGFPWSPQLVERSRRSSGATLEGAFSALSDGVAVNLAGGTHHAFRDHGEGYCLFNDSVVAARALQASGKIRRVLVVDTDVHQGNGTAAICRLDPTIFTFSIHGAKNYPLRKEVSDLDVELQDRAGDGEYLEALGNGLARAIEASRPDFAVWVAGADPYEDDRLGRLALTKSGLAARDLLVCETLKRAGLPATVAMAGGYARNVADTAEIHFGTVRTALAVLGGRVFGEGV